MTNREIKFRAWHPTQKMTLTPILKRSDFSGEVYCEGFTKDGSRCLLALMQYTGLKDKNGVEIYEGDLIKATGEHPAEVGFRFGTFILRHVNHTGMNGVSISDVATDRYEVIGNTYENPELLNK